MYFGDAGSVYSEILSGSRIINFSGNRLNDFASFCSTGAGGEDGASPAEFAALTDFYYATGGGKPDGWSASGWLSGCSSCGWLGVYCNDKGRVIYIELQGMNLKGSIPASFSALTSLSYLRLDRNWLTGSIPAALFNLTNLEYLYLDSNQLSGDIPTGLSNCHKVNCLPINCLCWKSLVKINVY